MAILKETGSANISIESPATYYIKTTGQARYRHEKNSEHIPYVYFDSSQTVEFSEYGTSEKLYIEALSGRVEYDTSPFSSNDIIESPRDVTFEELWTAIGPVVRPGVTRPSAIATCGDSITDDGHTGGVWNDIGWIAWFRRSLNPSFTMDAADSVALGGEGTDHLVTTQLPQVLASGVGFCITMIGINDVLNLISTDLIISRLETYYTTLSDNNIIAIAMPILPTEGTWELSDSERRQASKINQYLYNRALVNGDMFYFSALDEMSDYTTGNAKLTTLRDGLHTNKVGAQILGEKLVSLFNTAFPLDSTGAYALDGNTYDATENPNGNIFLNGYMRGTGGAAEGGVTGVVTADNEIRRLNAGSTFDVVAAKETIDGKVYQVMTPSGTGDGLGYMFRADVSTMALPASWVEGDIIEARMKVIAVGLAGIGSVELKMGNFGSTAADGTAGNAAGNMPSDFNCQYRVQGTLGSSATSAYIQLTALTVTGVAAAGAIKITDVTLQKVAV